MSYLLDTNACIQALNNQNSFVAQRIIRIPTECIYLCTIVCMELYYGAYKSRRTQENLNHLADFFRQFSILPFDQESSRITGYIRTGLEVAGMPIGLYDLQIAAIALSNDLILITHNTREFSRVHNLKYEDWE
ncbi:PIN domain nucleic acid-binding protein [Gloeomargarita lithophora Alchichica-D10]|uniref:PIN domain nucleic acid-binding protein n=1 Tax=Gloeomargarita lithophora Alchichica-D10 TaxID=1188229 RepID=A0A1J0ACB8_9CYAN|nr:type II toxin-antitoxin system VapC family toxin [Gloeomargarita lithophora]APB33553.1 PIN domain nucleic acid-binding protein [Gloeomargarita lithophora Alchichica-D10]